MEKEELAGRPEKDDLLAQSGKTTTENAYLISCGPRRADEPGGTHIVKE